MNFDDLVLNALHQNDNDLQRIAAAKEKRKKEEAYAQPIRCENIQKFVSTLKSHGISPQPIVKVDRSDYGQYGRVNHLGVVGYGWVVREPYNPWGDYAQGLALLDSVDMLEVAIDYAESGDGWTSVPVPPVLKFQKGMQLFCLEDPRETTNFGPAIERNSATKEQTGRWVNPGAEELARAAARLILENV